MCKATSVHFKQCQVLELPHCWPVINKKKLKLVGQHLIKM